MPRYALSTMLRRVISPTSGDCGTADLGVVVQRMWSGVALVALVNLVAHAAVGSAQAVDAGFTAVALAIAFATAPDAIQQRRAASELGLVAAVGVICAAIVVGDPTDSGHAAAAVVLLAWPLTIAAYFCSLARSAGLVLVAAALLGADLLVHGAGHGAVERLVVVAIVFGGMGPLISMVRLRADLSVRYLEEAAIRDPLTGLLNRRGFEDSLGRALDDEQGAALLIADIDYFKLVNDRHGHGTGDQLLGEVSMLLLLTSPPDAIVARVGGEEFAIILPGADYEDALECAEGLRAAIESTFDHTPTRVTLSVGIVVSGDVEGDMDSLVQRADKAVHAAKEMGRNRAVAYSDDVLDVLERARIRREEASRTQLATLLTLAEALDLRDPSTALHSRTVADYAEGMATELGLEPDMVERIRLAGLLHDIGKIGVPDSVLLHPGKLDDEQWALMRQHPEIGARMLNHVDYTDIRDWVLAHHERFDGFGYPAKLVGEHIPLAARILAVADSYEAMTADRVYRASLGHEFARGELHTCAGSQFDPKVVEAMDRYLDRAGIGTAPVTSIPVEQELGRDDADGGDSAIAA